MKFILMLSMAICLAFGQKNYRFSGGELSLSDALLSIGDAANINVLFSLESFKNQRIILKKDSTSVLDYLEEINLQFPINWRFSADHKTLIIRAKKKRITLLNEWQKPIAFALVKNDEINLGVSDSYGRVFIEQAETRFDVSHLSFKTGTFHQITGDTTLLLEERTYYSDPVRIVSSKTPITQIRKNNYVLGIKREALDELSYSSNLNDRFSQLAGLSFNRQKGAGLSIQAASDKQHLMLFDRIPIYQQSHLFGHVSSINYLAIDKINIYKGSYPAKYSGAVSGIIDIESRNPSFIKNKYVLQMDLLKTEGLAEFSINEHSSLLLSARRSLIDLYSNGFSKDLRHFIQRKQLYSNSTYIGQSGLKQELPTVLFQDYSLKYSNAFTPHDFFALSAYIGLDKNEMNSENNFQIGTTESYTYQNLEARTWENGGVSAVWLKKLNNAWTSNLQFSFSNLENNRSNNVSFEFDDHISSNQRSYYSNKNFVSENTARFSFNYQQTEQNHLTLGVHFQHIKNKVNNSLEDSARFGKDISESARVSSLFLQQQLQFGAFNVDAGLRLNSYSNAQKLFFEPRFSLGYKPSALGFTFNYSENYQYLKHVFAHASSEEADVSYWLLANDEEKADYARNFSATVSYSTARTETELELFYNIVENQNFSFDIYNRRADNLANFIAYSVRKGFSLSQFYRFYPFLLSIQYTLSKSEYTLETELRPLSLPTNLSDEELEEQRVYPSDNDQRHQLNILLSYKKQALRIDLENIYKSGSPFSNYNKNTIAQLITTAINNDRLPFFYELNLNTSYEIQYAESELLLGVRLKNLTNRKNIWTSYHFLDQVASNYTRVDIEHLRFFAMAYFKLSF
jgi:hypothetical protein